MKRLLYLLFVLFFSNHLFSQNNAIDSLIILLDSSKDSAKVRILQRIYSEYEKHDIEKGKMYLDEAYELSRNLNHHVLEVSVLLNIGNYYNLTGDYDQSIDTYFKAIEIASSVERTMDVATAYNNLGSTYEKKGDYENAMSYLIKAMETYEISSDSLHIAKTYLNLGLLHFRQENYEKSKEYYLLSLELREALNDKEGIALVYNNMAILNYYMEDYDNVRNYFEKAYNIYLELGNLRRQAMALSNLAEVYNLIGQKDKALDHYIKILDVEKRLNNRSEIIITYQNIGDLFLSRNNFNKAIENYDLALELAYEINAKLLIRDTYYRLYDVNKLLRKFEDALLYQELVNIYNDSIFNETKAKQIAELETKYETNKKEQEILLLKNEQEIKDLRIKKQRTLSIFLLFGILSILSFLYLIINRNKKIQEKNDLLAYQKKQITDSIEYASKIQSAVLPPEDYIKELLPNHFIFFKPRDIVSGDFYWITSSGNKIIVAAVDCTGHGVPGAFMSMLGYALLNEIDSSIGDVHANTILDKLRENTKKALHQTDTHSETKDGMDIALCVIDYENMQLEFAGAYNPLIHIREGNLSSIKGDRMPIGIHLKDDTSFTNNVLEIEKGDIIYLFTDGFIDQFGGEKGRKYKLLPFKELLLTTSLYSIEEQKDFLESSFEAWKQNHDQIDDVLVIGIKI